MFISGKNNYAWCENSECNHIYDISAVLANGKIVRYCPECKNKYCTKCKKIALGNHEIACERKWIQENDVECEEWIVMNTITCPNCKFSFEKSGGCNHMTCPCCKSHFCFLCGAIIFDKIPVDHYRIKNTICYNRYMIQH